MEQIVKKMSLFGISLLITCNVFGYATLSSKMTQVATTTSYKNTYAVIIAVADYQYFPAQTGGDLRYTDDDARKFYQFLCAKSGGNIPPQNIQLLINKRATKAAILNAITKVFARAKADDRIIFYFSGHGLPGYLIPNDGLSDDIKTFLSFKELKRRLRFSPAKTKLCFIDACNANSIKLGTHQNSKTEAAQKVSAKKDKNSNVVIMVSSQSYQYSQENMQLKQGVFSYYLINGLKGKADKNKDRTISIAELHQYVYKNVKSYTMDSQTPHTYGNFDIHMPVVTLK